MRPHDVIIETSRIEGGIPAKISRLIHLGWEILAELVFDDGNIITANLSREQYDKLNLQPQQKVFVKPKNAKAFPAAYAA